tara:strand:- start:89 stop:403 length:315 start_codon:yes stop_codon:yes gene_type:complete
MAEADKNMSIGDVTKMLTDFEKAGMKMEMKNDAMTDAMGQEDNGEADEIYGAIMSEIGVDIDMGATTGAGVIQSNKKVAAPVEEEKVDNEVDDLEARMAALGGM